MTPAELGLVPMTGTEPDYEPRVWQQRDLNFMSPMPWSANWSQMGCFKTSTALWLLQKKRCKNTLIITSKIGKGAYFSDFYRCLPKEWQMYNLSTHKATLRIGDFEKEVDLPELLEVVKRKHHNHPIVFLAHYDIFTNKANQSSRRKNDGGMGILDRLRQIEWDMVLCDEGHRMKNREGQWVINIKKLKAKAKHIMTGTGFVNNPAEIWSLLNFLDPVQFGNYWRFRGHFCEEIITPANFRIIRGIKPGRVNEFRDLRKSFGPRHTMAEVHRGIDKPIETTYEVDLNPTQRRMYLDIKSTLQTMDRTGQTIASPNVISMLNRCRQICVATPKVVGRVFNSTASRMVTEIELEEGSAKLDVVMDILKELDEPEQKVVVFSNFVDPLKLLKVRLEAADIGYVHMEQKHTEDVRYRIWHDDFPKPENKMFLSTLALGGESINLTCAQYLIFLDRAWSPATMNQAIGRVYRPGQKNAVEVIYINARGTVDAYVKSKLDQKNGWFNQIFGD